MQFMTDGTVTVMTRASAAGQPISGAVGSLQCPNKKAAQDFDCALPHDSCLCNFQDDKYGKVTCACVHGDLTNVMANDQHILPMVTQGISIMPVSNKGVTVEFDQISVLEVQMTFQGFKLRTQIDKSLCVVKPYNLSGCYSCITGANLKYTCTTDFAEALAHVNCGETIKFSVLCKNEAEVKNTTISFSDPTVDTQCRVTCPGGTTNFRLKSTLVFIESSPLFGISNMISSKRIPVESWWNFWKLDIFSTIWKYFRGHLVKAVIGAMIVITLAAIALILTLAIGKRIMTNYNPAYLAYGFIKKKIV